MEHYKRHIRLDHKSLGYESPEKILARFLRKKHDSVEKAFLIAVGGAGGTGKSTFAQKLKKELKNASILTLDDYKTSRKIRARKNIYGPHPEANEMDLLRSHLEKIELGEPVNKPVYCREKGRISSTERFLPAGFIIIEGEISTYREFHHFMDLSIFIDSHWKTQLQTRIKRDIEKRGYTPEKAISSFLNSNLREFSEYGEASKNWSDLILYCDSGYSISLEAVSEENFAGVSEFLDSSPAQVG